VVPSERGKDESLKYQPGPLQRIRDVEVGEGTVIGDFVNLYECRIGARTIISDFVEIGKTVSIGHHCRISAHAYVCPGVTIEDDVFVGEQVTFINDRFPRATNDDGTPCTESDWTVRPTLVKRGASIAAGAVILCDVTIGVEAHVSAGAVVTRDVPDGATVAGNPARVIFPTRNN
jgi:UDP-2-acetamido-3-amino-2,3-dideoxy-glucuronate N-acetyltransferase